MIETLGSCFKPIIRLYIAKDEAGLCLCGRIHYEKSMIFLLGKPASTIFSEN